jgi:hypothetical protein
MAVDGDDAEELGGDDADVERGHANSLSFVTWAQLR